MCQWYNWQLHLHYLHVWWVVLHLKRVTRILFRTQKLFKTGSCSKPHIHLIRELSHKTRLPEIIPSTKHMLCDIVSCQYHWVQLQTLAKMNFITMSLLWSNMVKCSTPSSADSFRTDCVVIVQWKQQPRHRSLFGTSVDCSGENPSYSST
jgi:hypothetical protein